MSRYPLPSFRSKHCFPLSICIRPSWTQHETDVFQSRSRLALVPRMQPLPVYNSRALAGAWEHPAQDPPRDLPRDLLLDSVPTWACLLRQPPFGAKLLLASSNTLPRPAGTLRALASRRAAPARGITSLLPAPQGSVTYTHHP